MSAECVLKGLHERTDWTFTKQTSILYLKQQSSLARILDVAKLFQRKEIWKFTIGFIMEKNHSNVVYVINVLSLLAIKGIMKEDIQKLSRTNALFVRKITIEGICWQFIWKNIILNMLNQHLACYIKIML